MMRRSRHRRHERKTNVLNITLGKDVPIGISVIAKFSEVFRSFSQVPIFVFLFNSLALQLFRFNNLSRLFRIITRVRLSNYVVYGKSTRYKTRCYPVSSYCPSRESYHFAQHHVREGSRNPLPSSSKQRLSVRAASDYYHQEHHHYHHLHEQQHYHHHHQHHHQNHHHYQHHR